MKKIIILVFVGILLMQLVLANDDFKISISAVCSKENYNIQKYNANEVSIDSMDSSKDLFEVFKEATTELQYDRYFITAYCPAEYNVEDIRCYPYVNREDIRLVGLYTTFDNSEGGYCSYTADSAFKSTIRINCVKSDNELKFYDINNNEDINNVDHKLDKFEVHREAEAEASGSHYLISVSCPELYSVENIICYPLAPNNDINLFSLNVYVNAENAANGAVCSFNADSSFKAKISAMCVKNENDIQKVHKEELGKESEDNRYLLGVQCPESFGADNIRCNVFQERTDINLIGFDNNFDETVGAFCGYIIDSNENEQEYHENNEEISIEDGSYCSVDATGCPNWNYKEIMYGIISTQKVWNYTEFVPLKVCTQMDELGNGGAWRVDSQLKCVIVKIEDSDKRSENERKRYEEYLESLKLVPKEPAENEDVSDEKEEVKSNKTSEILDFQKLCAGCIHGENCIPIGSRFDNQYCSLKMELVSQKNNDEQCDNDYECITNNCKESLCKPICQGCVDKNNNCLPVGTRIEKQFCDADYSFKETKSEDNSCSNNYECSSNVCVNNECISQNLIQKIINWLKNLFGK